MTAPPLADAPAGDAVATPAAPGATRRWALAAGALALALFAGLLRAHPATDEVVYPDAAVYMRQAQGYLEGQASIAPPWRRMPAGGPLYPALTALVTPLAGDVERAGVWVSRASGVALVLLVAGLALALGGPVSGPVAAVAAGVLTAVAPRLIHFSEVRLTEALFAALTVAALAWCVRVARGRGRAWEGWTLGALLGAVALTRAVGAVTLPAAVAAVALAGALLLREAPRAWAMRAARVALGGLLVLGAYQGVAWGHGWYTAFDTHLPPFLRHTPAETAAPPAPVPEGGAAAGPAATADADASGAVLDALEQGGATLERQGRSFGRLLPALLWLLAGAGLAWRLARARGPGRAAELVLLGWCAAYLVVLAAFGTSLARYLLAAAPVIFVYAGCGVGALGEGTVLALRRVAPAGVAVAAGLGLAVAVGGVTAARLHRVFEVPEGVYPPVRALAADVRAAVPLLDPVAVFAAHAYLPYYLHGYWAGLPGPPEGLPAGGAGSRVVVLEAVHAPRWDPAWRTAVATGADVGPFHLVAQRYYPDQLNLISVYADAAPAPGTATGDALLADGRLAAAREAFARAGSANAAARADALRALALAPYLPEDLETARRRYADAAAGAAGAAVIAATGPPVAWALPPGVIYLGVGEVATAWNRAALALALDRPEAAARFASRAARLAPRLGAEPRMAYLLGLILASAGRNASALGLLETARRGLPDDPGVAVAWANAMASQGRYADAVGGYEQVLEREPRNAGIWLNLAHARARSGDRAGARAALERARGLRLRPVDREYLDVLERRVVGVPGPDRPDG